MANKKPAEENRILDEMREMASALQDHALIPKQDMAKMQLICQSPPQCCLTNKEAKLQVEERP